MANIAEEQESKSRGIGFFGEKMIDGHVHLEKGPLTKEYVYEFINEAIHKGIDELQILDHTHRFKEFEEVYEPYRINKAQIDWLDHDLRNSLNEYIALIEEMKKEKLPIKVTFGLEVCYQKDDEKIIRNKCSIYPFDYLIGSVHAIRHIVYDSNWSKDELWNRYPVDDIYKEYYEEMYSLIESDIFTQLGHPDTIKMFNYYPSFDLSDYNTKLARLAYKHHIKVENNVGCYYRYGHKDMGLSDELLKIFKDNHCEMITVSDAHLPKDVGNFIKDVWEKTMY